MALPGVKLMCMKRRTRTLGALMALLAFTAYFAENVWASMCMPGAGAEMTMMAHADAHEGASAGAPDRAAGHVETDDGHAMAGEAAPRAPDGTPAPACPLGAGSVGSSCVALSLPGSSSAFDSRDTLSSGVNLSPPGPGEILLASALFRPPRA
jgi:hypothetical protein